ncbi:MAG: hypothetical protein ISR69_00100 [Gammaproteobacteria bacterium]|nr:hypothetical protein [Gammaproteobacteria bacterium]
MSVNNRLLLDIQNRIRSANKGIINPEIPELSVEQIIPVMEMVAHARAAYLKALFNITDNCEGVVPSAGEVKKLALQRQIYEELVKGAQALETAIERGYLDIES